MKKKYFFITLLACISLQMQAQVYVLNDDAERSFSTISSYTYNLDGRPAGQLTFDAKKSSSLGLGDLRVKQYVNGTWSDQIAVASCSKNYASFGPFTLDRNATQIQLYTTTGATLSKYFKNVKVTMASYIEPSTNTLSFSTELGTAAALSFSVSHSNVNQLSVSSSDNSIFTPDITTISNSGSGKYGTQDITITYNPTTAGTHTGTITISDGTKSATINVSGTATKRAQSLTWNAQSTISVGNTLSNVATASSGLDVTLTSDNAAIIKVENGQLVAVAPGTANITATQAGNALWESVSESKLFTATELLVQTIAWNQDFLRLKVGDAPVTLNATATSGLPISYTSSDENVVSITGNTLTIVSVGSTSITATQAGDATYAASSLSKTVRVRLVSDGCMEYVLDDASERSIYTIGDGPALELSGPGSQVYFEGSKTTLAASYFFLQQSTNGGSSWNDVVSQDLTNSWTTYGPFDISKDATHIRFITKTGATLTKYYRNIKVTQATYLETDRDSISFNAMLGTTMQMSLTVKYSNLPDIISISNSNPLFSLTNASDFGNGCGDFGSHTLQINFTADTLQNAFDTLNIVCANRTLRIPMAAYAVRKTQAISWEQDLSTLQITDTVALTAFASSDLPVSYTSSDSNVAVVENGILHFVGAGSVQITASQEGNEEFQAAQDMTKTITIERITPTITVEPTVANITYGQTLAEATISGGTTSVAGSFVWNDDTMQPNAGAGQTFEATFIPDNLAYFSSVSMLLTVNVAKAAQSISWAQDLFLIHVGDTVLLTASSSVGLPITYTTSANQIVISNDTLTAIFAGNGQITATQAGNENYLEAEAVVLSFSVVDGAVSITTLPNASNIAYGQTLADAALTGGEASVAGTFAWADPNFAPNAGQSQQFEVVFTPTATELSPINFMLTIDVAKATQTLMWEQNLLGLHLGDTVTLTCTASSHLPIEYVAEDTTVVRVVGNKLIPLIVGNTQLTATQSGNSNYLATADGITVYVSVEDVTSANSSLMSNIVIAQQGDLLHVNAEYLAQVRLYTLQGMLAATQQADDNAATLHIANLPKGIYALQMLINGDSCTRTIVLK